MVEDLKRAQCQKENKLGGKILVWALPTVVVNAGVPPEGVEKKITHCFKITQARWAVTVNVVI